MILYEVKATYERQMGDSNPSKAKEVYLVEAVNMADAERQVEEEVTPYVFGGELEMASCRKVQYYDIFNDPNAEHFYKGRVELITVENEKETRKTVSILVAANSTKEADKVLREKLAMLDIEIVSVAKTAIVDYLQPVH